MDRRRFLASGLAALAVAATSRVAFEALDDDDGDSGGGEGGKASGSRRQDGDRPAIGPLREPDRNGLRLPDGFTSRVVAVSAAVVEGTDYKWHGAPDGGACFPRGDGGWVYVSNSEIGDRGGGVSALEFEADGTISGARRILEGTSRNCAGGPTPWRTWLSCEEHERGVVWECDPRGDEDARSWPALGVFKHEAAAVDAANMHVYQTEDEDDGRFYRFTAERRLDNGRLDLSSGVLEVAVVGFDADRVRGEVEWRPVPDPAARAGRPTRHQVDGSTPFDGGEGAWFHDGHVYWAAKGDDRVYDYDTASGILHLLYGADRAANPILKGVDNVTVTPWGDVLVAEDGDDMQLCVLTVGGNGEPTLVPLVQVVGHEGSEMTGPAFSPDGSRLYFSSQRGASGKGAGVTYEITGPFT